MGGGSATCLDGCSVMALHQPYFWLSFSDPDAPAGHRWLGGTLVTGCDIEQAIENAWRLGVNPGGAVLQGNEFRLTDLDSGGCCWRFWMRSEDLDPQRLCDPAPKCHYSVQGTLLGARWEASQPNPLT